ncbi:MAG: bifunctional phosphopantothenoylcysteine decarboxylase/phosphopantothenate--cysteine ligase CoaBC [Thermoanaerobaculia bacterium]|nr:MAG: bifunctional phosphopantothenoylcysteine decarboxylase/phosphopantothenate--cysteine ligase CoaBC [Thermoanaerobaculia bacterium]
MEPERSERGRRVLLGVTGGIAAYKAPELVRRLRERGFAVRCALTPAATTFVSPLALEVVSGRAVHREEYLTPTGSGAELHVEAAAWADLLLIAPATAHTLASLALGLADNFLLTTALAFRGPVLVAPALHTAMWEHPALRARVAELRARGVALVGPATGPLASGESGPGRMAEIAEIVDAVERAFAPRDLDGRTVLVTAGPTFEPIDPVRFLGNRSSGKMGFAIAAEAARRGARALLVSGPVALATPPGVERIAVETALEMEAAVRERAVACDIVVMAAAVADFRPREPASSKLSKSAGVPRLELVVNPDILHRLAEWAPGALRVGFAAETGDPDSAARQKLEAKDAHVLVANDVSRSGIGFGSDDNEVTVHRRDAPPLALSRRPKSALARDLVDLFVAELRALRREDLAVPR